MTKLDLIDTTIQPDPFKPQAGDVYEFGHPFTQRLVVEDAPSVGDFRVRFRIDGGDSSLTSVRAFHLLLAGFRGLRGIGRVVEMTAENAAVWARSKRAERAEEHANPDLAPFANLSVADIAHAAWLCGYGPGDEPMQVFKLAAARAAEWQEIEGATRQIAMANPGSPLKVPAVVSKLIGEHAATVAKAHRLVAEAIGLMREDVAALPEADPLAYTLHRALQRGVSVGMSWSGKADDEQHAKACAEVDKLGDPEQVAQLKGLRPWAMVRELVGRLVQECRNLDDARAKLVSEQVDVSERRMALEAVQSSLRAAMFSALGHEDSTLSVLDLVEQLVHAIRERDEQINTLSSQRDRFFDDYTIVAKREKATAARLTATERRIADGDNAIQALLTLGWTSDDDPREWACNEGREVDLLKQRVATYEEDFGSLIAAGWTNGHPVKWAQDKFAELTKERDEARQFGLEAALVAAREEIRMLRDREDVARLDRTSTAAWMQSSPLDCLDDSPDIRCWPATGIVIPGSAGPVLTIMPEDGGNVAIVHMEDVAAWLQAYKESAIGTALPESNPPATVPDHLWAVERFGDDAPVGYNVDGTVMAKTNVADLAVTVLAVKSRIVVLKQKWTSEDPAFDAASVSLQDDDPRFSSGMGFGARKGTWIWSGTMSGTMEWMGEWTETSVLAAGVIPDLGRKDRIRVDGVATEHIHCLVGEPLMLSNADDAGVTSWRWSVVAPQTSDPKRRWSWGKPHFSFTTDVLGDYTVHLHVVREGSEQELTLTVRAS